MLEENSLTYIKEIRFHFFHYLLYILFDYLLYILFDYLYICFLTITNPVIKIVDPFPL
jgi:hypothetical protein